MVLKGRLGRPSKRGGGLAGGGGGMIPLARLRSGSYDAATSGAGGGGVDSTTGGVFLHAAFSGDGADLLACTATKFFRFPLGGG